MNWKRYFRFRHFYHTLGFLLQDTFVFRKKVLVQPKTILIVRLEAIGDYIFVRNFFAILQNSSKFKGYQITLCGNELWKDLAEQFDGSVVDRFIWVNKRKLGTDAVYRNSILTQIHNCGFEYAVQPNFSREILWGDSIIRASNAPFRIGSEGDMANDLAVFKSLSNRWFTQLISKNGEPIFEFERNKVFFEELLEEKISLLKPQISSADFTLQNYIVLFPGAGEKIKQWSTENFSKWITLFRERYSNEIYICGSKGDFDLAEEIVAGSKGLAGVYNNCGKTNLPELVDFINEATLLITNDSSAFHMGAAQNTPTICLLMGRHYGRFAPYPKGTCPKLITLYPKRFLMALDQHENIYQEMQFSSPYSINEIEVSEVLNATYTLLS